jgi:hypothetical protein
VFPGSWDSFIFNIGSSATIFDLSLSIKNQIQWVQWKQLSFELAFQCVKYLWGCYLFKNTALLWWVQIYDDHHAPTLLHRVIQKNIEKNKTVCFFDCKCFYIFNSKSLTWHPQTFWVCCWGHETASSLI